jgi:branched-chain amino acid transport system ATP-binding protein
LSSLHDAAESASDTADGADDPGPSAQPVLSLESISVQFGGVNALDGVDLSVAVGEVLGLIGPNGAGKTTLFDVISGVRSPDRGRVHLGGEDVTSWSPVRRAKAGLRRTFQQVQVFGWLSVEENVLAALDWRGGGGGACADLVAFPTRRKRESFRRQRVEEVLEICGLSEVAARSAASLPIAQARAVELARAIADKPRLLLLDEPNSGLDHAESDRLAACIQNLRRDLACAVLLVEHDVDFIMEQCDRIVVLNVGQVLSSGSGEEVRSNPAVQAAYLGA